MKIKKFIKKLQEIENIYGNIEVVNNVVTVVDTKEIYFFNEKEKPFQVNKEWKRMRDGGNGIPLINKNV